MQEIRRIRKVRGLSQERLAFMANVNKVTLVHIETGQVSPKVETLEKIAAALDVEVGDFFPKVQSPLQLWPSEIGQEERDVIETIEGLNERVSALLLLNGEPEMWTIAVALIHNVGRLVPALMKNEALAEELRPLVARTAELGRELLVGVKNAARNVDTIPPETTVGLDVLEGDVISLERYRKAS